MNKKTAAVTICQIAKDNRMTDRFEVVEAFGQEAPKVGTRGLWHELKADYPHAGFSINSAVVIDYKTGKQL